MRQEPVDQLTVRAAPLNPVTIADQHDTLPHRPSQGHLTCLTAASSQVWDVRQSGRVTGLRAD
jgi:hypothetical protein